MWVVDADNHQIVDVNKAALSLYGYSKAEMLSFTTADLRSGKKMNPSGNQKNQLNAENIQKHITKSGDPIFVRLTSHLIQIDGQTHWLFVADDVTKQTRQEQQLRASQQLFELIKEKLPLALFVMDQQGNMLQWNSYKEKLSGYSHKEVNELHALDFFDSNSQPDIDQALQDVLNKGKAEVEDNLVTKSGDKIPMLYKAHSVQIEGQQQVLGFGVDISELKKAQQKTEANRQLLQSIINQSKSLIFVKDQEGRFRFVNKEFLSFFDLPADAVIGKRDLDIMDENDAQPMQQSDKKVREDGGPLELEEHVHLDGEEPRVFLTTKVLFQGIPGFENHVLGLSRDITQRKKMEQQLEKSAKENQILLSEIHHRVKNNLAIISGFLDLQAMETDNVGLRNNLKDSQSRILSIASTHELLYEEQDFSAIDFDKNIKKLVETIADTLSPDVTFRSSMDSVKLNINQAIPCSLIINEIVTNAIKHAYGEKEEAIIDIILRENDGSIFLSVRDYGQGLPEDFDFNHNTSLGLNLIQVLKQQLNAELNINSSGGTTFELTFKKTDTNRSSSNSFEKNSDNLKKKT